MRIERDLLKERRSFGQRRRPESVSALQVFGFIDAEKTSCSWSDLLEDLEMASCQTEQLWGAREVPIGGAWLTVAQVGRERRQARLDVLAVAIPVDQRMNGEGVAQIVNVGVDRRLGSDASGVGELPKT